MQSAQGLFSINSFLLGTHVEKMPLMFMSKKKPDRLIDGVTNSLMRLPNLQAARRLTGWGSRLCMYMNEHHLTLWGPLPLGLRPQFTLVFSCGQGACPANKFYTQLLTYFFIVLKSKCKMMMGQSSE